jgi:hypothetical protein
MNFELQDRYSFSGWRAETTPVTVLGPSFSFFSSGLQSIVEGNDCYLWNEGGFRGLFVT